MLHITSLSVQDRLSQEGRKQAFVMELAGPHDQGEFVVEIDEVVYGRLLKVYEAVSGRSSFGDPAIPIESVERGRVDTPVPSVTEEEIRNVQEMLQEEENRIVLRGEIGGPPQQFAGKHIGPVEAAMLQGIGMDVEPSHQDISEDVFGEYDDDEDEGEILSEDVSQL